MSRVKPRPRPRNLNAAVFKNIYIIFKVVWRAQGPDMGSTTGKFPGLYISEYQWPALDFPPISQPPLPIKHSGTGPPTRGPPGSSAGGIVRLPIVCQGTLLLVLAYLIFTILVFPVIPVIPESPVFGPRPLRVKPILGKVPVCGLMSTKYSVLRTGFSNLIVFSIWV